MTSTPSSVIVATNDEADLSVWRLGTDLAGDCVLLLHGFSLDHSTWLPVALSLADAGYNVVVPDLRGHGRSSLGSAAPSLDRLVEDVATIIEKLGLRPIHLVGHSLGAVVALRARTELPRDQLLSVTSVAGTERSLQNPVMKLGARFFSSSTGIKLLRRRRFGRLMISTWFGKDADPEQMDWIRLLSADCDAETRQRISGATSDIDLRDSFAMDGPSTLVVVGSRDQATPPKVSKRIAAAIAGADLEVVEGAGHMVIIEESDALASRLETWFTSLS